LIELDALRGIAVFSVVLFHYTTRYDSIYGHSSELLFKFDHGHLGVNLFFIISGFVIFLTLERTKSVIDFTVARFSRLYPAYWAAAILTYTVISSGGLPGREVKIEHALANLSMLQQWFYVPHIDGVYWTLTVELSFYSIMIALYALALLRYIEGISVLWLILVVTHRFGIVHGLTANLLILDYASLFIAGMMFYLVKQGRGNIFHHAIICLSFMIYILGESTSQVLAIAIFFGLFYCFAYNHLRFIAVRPLTWLGTISYTLYLVHQNIGYLAMNNLYGLNINANICVLLTILLSLSLATLITYSVEKPAMRLIRNRYKGFLTRRVAVPAGVFCFAFFPPDANGMEDTKWPAEVKEVEFVSSGDSSKQKALFYAPPAGGPAPLLFGIHTWSGDFRQESSVPYALWAIRNNWAFIHPNLRGANDRPEATGSELVMADIASALEFAYKNANIDPDRIYLVGVSGGGYTSLLAAARFPDVWAGVSVWAPIADLSCWYLESRSRGLKYADDIVKSCGAPPGHDAGADLQYWTRSPLNQMGQLKAVHLDINAGIRDGHEGSVPVSHALKAFNILAVPAARLDNVDIEYIVNSSKVPDHLVSKIHDPAYGEKRPLFRRLSGNTRITIFDGGHEIIHEAALQWLAAQRKIKNHPN
jgi:peptidoglycan/LPS O-acetylase OafA/YrhL/pimeloyl-ACP methyl ester carboxylesterase